MISSPLIAVKTVSFIKVIVFPSRRDCRGNPLSRLLCNILPRRSDDILSLLRRSVQKLLIECCDDSWRISLCSSFALVFCGAVCSFYFRVAFLTSPQRVLNNLHHSFSHSHCALQMAQSFALHLPQL